MVAKKSEVLVTGTSADGASGGISIEFSGGSNTSEWIPAGDTGTIGGASSVGCTSSGPEGSNCQWGVVECCNAPWFLPHA